MSSPLAEHHTFNNFSTYLSQLDAEPNKEGLMSKMIHLKTAEEVMDEEQTNNKYVLLK